MGKHSKTLAAVFRRPPPRAFPWRDIEALFTHYGAEVTEGEGSRVRVELNGVRAVFHRPHPCNEIRARTISDVRDFLEAAGITP